MSIRSILVTGGCGFIGSNLAPYLIDRGYEVSVFDNLSIGSREALTGLPVEVHTGDILDRQAVDSAMRECDAVVHLAAHSSVVDSIENPMVDAQINVMGTLNVLQAAVAHKVQSFVQASSNAPIGEQPPPSSEDKAARPSAPYGASKLACEGYCSAFHKSYGLKAVALRFANAYGPRSTHKASAVAKFIRLILSGEGLTIFGDGGQTRDFVHVQDICQGIHKALISERGGELYCLGTGIETSVLRLVDLFREISGLDFPVAHVPARAGEITRNYTDISKARAELGFEPTVELRDGLRACFNWFVESTGHTQSVTAG